MYMLEAASLSLHFHDMATTFWLLATLFWVLLTWYYQETSPNKLPRKNNGYSGMPGGYRETRLRDASTGRWSSKDTMVSPSSIPNRLHRTAGTGISLAEFSLQLETLADDQGSGECEALDTNRRRTQVGGGDSRQGGRRSKRSNVLYPASAIPSGSHTLTDVGYENTIDSGPVTASSSHSARGTRKNRTVLNVRSPVVGVNEQDDANQSMDADVHMSYFPDTASSTPVIPPASGQLPDINDAFQYMGTKPLLKGTPKSAPTTPLNNRSRKQSTGSSSRSKTKSKSLNSTPSSASFNDFLQRNGFMPMEFGAFPTTPSRTPATQAGHSPFVHVGSKRRSRNPITAMTRVEDELGIDHIKMETNEMDLDGFEDKEKMEVD